VLAASALASFRQAFAADLETAWRRKVSG